MLFNSYIFVLFFLPLTLFGYFAINRYINHRIALVELILMSLIFYCYNNIYYGWLLITSILVNWGITKLICYSNYRIKRIILILGIMVNIMLIFYFKYYNFFIENMNWIFRKSYNLLNVMLPLGISFYTFQQISYLVDSYREVGTKEYSFIEYAAFVCFFPQLVAGPIVLHNEIIPQFRDKSKWRFSHENFSHGTYIFAIGMFKKVIIADTFGKVVTWGWSNTNTMTSIEIVLVMFAYTFQIYYDFSGYSDMAIGIGKMFNIALPINFNSPYKACSVIEFWDRWHITLTRFLRTYIYFPLGGGWQGTVCKYRNVLIVFLVSGIWHGANWTFVFWGMLHGIANILNRIFEKGWEKCNVIIQWISTFLFINIAWLFFRADSIGQAFELIKRAVMLEEVGVRNELINCFYFVETDILCVLIGKYANFNICIMVVFYMGALFSCIKCKNINEKEFKTSMKSALCTSFLFVWCIMTFSGVSSFLYFNF